MALGAVISSKLPMVIVLGATGTGKTKLGIELARKFGGEIISADSMQIYKGLDIVTAKATPQEREEAPHHLLDILEPHQMFTVVDFRNRTLKIIDNLAEQGKMPIIVGGTHYYLESIVYKILIEPIGNDKALLWDISRRKRPLEDDDDSNPKRIATEQSIDQASPTSSKDKTKVEDEQGECISYNDEALEKEFMKDLIQQIFDNEQNFSNKELYEKLQSIDPDMASRHHPNNRRKILRSIEVWLKSGRKHSQILLEQRAVEGELRRPEDTIILWLRCDQEIHDERLNARVDTMLKQGLVQELLDFHARHNQQRMDDDKPPDYTKGVFQTLGLKEFHKYLMLPPEVRETGVGEKILAESIESMKIATRRFARRQNKMVLGRFLEHPTRQVPPIYELDTSDVAKWDENVKNKAMHIIESYIKKSTCDFEPLKPHTAQRNQPYDAHSYNFCDVCNRILLGDNTYAIHLKSTRHNKVLKMKNRKEKLDQNEDDKNKNKS